MSAPGQRSLPRKSLLNSTASPARLSLMPKSRALIIGGSVGGLFAANMLRSIGWNATVFERNAEELSGRGAGISTHPQLHAVTKRLGIPFDDSMGIAVDSVVFLDHDGRAYDQRDTVRLMSSWGRVFRSLRDPIPDDSYRLRKALARGGQGARGVTPSFPPRTPPPRGLPVGEQRGPPARGRAVPARPHPPTAAHCAR